MASSHNLVYIHGWGTSPCVWRKQIEYFSRKCNVEAPSVIASDCEAKPKQAFSRERSEAGSNLLRRLLRRFAPRNDSNELPILVGWSYGGMLSIEMAVKNPGHIKALVLVGCTAKFSDKDTGLKPVIIKNLRRNLERNFEDTMRNCYGIFFSDEEHRHIAGFIQEQVMPDKKTAINMLDEIADLDLKGILKDITIPTLIIHGDKDGVCPIGAGRYLHEHIKGSRFKIIKGAGHAPFYTRADEFNKILEEFLAYVK